MSKKLIFTKDHLKRMHFIELELLAELDRVCRSHNIPYVITAGTLLGAVRHKGFIPWDDDADVAMLREDYERFKREAMKDLNPEICFFQDNTTDPEYRWGYAKLRRTGTQYIREGQEHLKCKTGVFIDIFPMDDIPNNIMGQIFQDAYCYCCRKILWSEVGRKQSKGFKRIWFSILSRISPSSVYKALEIYTKKSRNKSKNRVRLLLFIAPGMECYKHPLKERFGLVKSWISERSLYNFENLTLYGTKDYHAYLKYTYNDYMQLPPEEEREGHAPVSSLDLGDLFIHI